ncbi:antibiotic ABC transporter ATP-binding protein [candidate division LCP-89 bacterium B3_LCP]|uniref:Antibiotic ABC transporter ATP-binding protein n=1 Tax=candidate division LCP-89 bacterium B3_LCP TaxID=2012998 RepID=A0A532UTY6_UNCL8|nr:MAG: antibiotic ABC transporter ATP-binding protein [candidate division LCP-89 bacterium B3_LCP]
MPSPYEEDEITGKAYDARLMKRLLKYGSPYKLQLVVGVLLLLIVSGLELVGPLLTKKAVDVHIPAKDINGLLFILFLYALVLAGIFIGRFLQIYITNWVGQKVIFDIRSQLFDKLTQLSISFFDRNPVGRIMTRISSDVDVLNQMFTQGIVAIFGDIFILLGIIIVMLVLNWKLALVTFAVLPILFWIAFWFKIRVRDAFREMRQRLASVNSYLQENIIGMRIVQLFRREKKNLNRFTDLNAALLDSHLRTIFYFAVFFPSVELISAVAVALILWTGGGMILHDALTLGSLIAFLLYAERFYRPVRDLAEKYNILQSAMASSERLFKLLDEDPEIKDPPAPADLKSTNSSIEFMNVSFSYTGREKVLQNVSFKVEPGQTVAVVGYTGAGKTTLVNLLSRFYDVQEGEILLGGMDIRNIRQCDLRSQLGVVQQDVFIFARSVEENIRLGSPIESDRVKQAALATNVNRFADKLPDGYDTKLEERGATLSSGERQLLAFARALVHDPPILILDEATSAVDTQTELLIQKAIAKLLEGRTAIIIAHRLSTIQHADKILVLHAGQLRESGTHQELLRKKGLYHRLYQLQYQANSGAS